MDPTSEARRRRGPVALIVLLIMAVASLVAGPGSGPQSWSAVPEKSVAQTAEHSTRALEALRTVSVSTMHRVAHHERMASARAALTALSFVALALVALAGLGSVAEAGPRARPRWWGGRCWRAPPVTTTA